MYNINFVSEPVARTENQETSLRIICVGKKVMDDMAMHVYNLIRFILGLKFKSINRKCGNTTKTLYINEFCAQNFPYNVDRAVRVFQPLRSSYSP